jgi:hypothetical protein
MTISVSGWVVDCFLACGCQVSRIRLPADCSVCRTRAVKPRTRSHVVVLNQRLNLIPRGLINRLARETGVEAKARSFIVLSHGIEPSLEASGS